MGLKCVIWKNRVFFRNVNDIINISNKFRKQLLVVMNYYTNHRLFKCFSIYQQLVIYSHKSIMQNGFIIWRCFKA